MGLFLGMKTITQLRKRRGVSPVIATVILVAVTITVAVAVAYWMSGIASQYTQFEQVKIQSSYASRKYDTTTFMGWVIQIELQNTGSSTSTLETLFINDRPIEEYGTYVDGGAGDRNKIRWTSATAPGSDGWTADWEGLADATSVSLDSGDEDTIYVLIYGEDGTGLFSAGTTINVKLHSAAGMDYIKLVKLN